MLSVINCTKTIFLLFLWLQGVRIAVCAVPLKKIAGMAAKVQAAMQVVEKNNIDNNQRPELKKFRSFFP